MAEMGLVSRVTPVHTAVRNCTRDEGGPFEVGNQVLISSHRKLLSSKAMVVNVAEKSGQRFRQARLREASASEHLLGGLLDARQESVVLIHPRDTCIQQYLGK